MPKQKAAPKKAPAKKLKAVAPAEADGNGQPEDGIDTAALKKIFDEAARAEAGGPTLKWVDVECPHCGEEFEVRVGAVDGGVDMVEECQACSKPVSLSVEIDDEGEVSVSAYQ